MWHRKTEDRAQGELLNSKMHIWRFVTQQPQPQQQPRCVDDQVILLAQLSIFHKKSSIRQVARFAPGGSTPPKIQLQHLRYIYSSNERSSGRTYPAGIRIKRVNGHMGNVYIRMIKRNVLKYTMCWMELHAKAFCIQTDAVPPVQCFISVHLTTLPPCAAAPRLPQDVSDTKHMSSVISTGGFNGGVRVILPGEAARRKRVAVQHLLALALESSRSAELRS